MKNNGRVLLGQMICAIHPFCSRSDEGNMQSCFKIMVALFVLNVVA
jgi:hypothetical protein